MAMAQMENKYPKTLGVLILIMIGVVCFALWVGRYPMTLADPLKILLSRLIPIEPTWTGTMEAVIFKLRLPRITAALLVGGALALSGAAYQSMFKNPMVSPDILGVSSGASVGASLAILLGLGKITIQVWAFIGGVVAVLLTASVPKLLRSNSTIILVLAGIIVGGLMSSIMGIIKYIATPDTALAEMTYWAMGSLAKVHYVDLIYIAPVLILSGLVLLLSRYRLNVLSLGEEEAKSLGVHVGKTRGIIILCSTLLTASSVCIAGTIGWVGLIIPHLGRMLVGPDNQKMLPTAMIIGGTFMVIIDTTARTLSSAELPIGIITGIVGAPFYFWLLLKQRMILQ